MADAFDNPQAAVNNVSPSKAIKQVNTHALLPQDSTLTIAQKIGLLDLPLEIWSKIGRLTLDEAMPFRLDSGIIERHSRCHQPPLTRTSRVLREELLSYSYSIKVNIQYAAAYNLGRWLRALDSDVRRAIRGIETDVSRSGPMTQTASQQLMVGDWKVGLVLDEVIAPSEYRCGRNEVRFL